MYLWFRTGHNDLQKDETKRGLFKVDLPETLLI